MEEDAKILSIDTVPKRKRGRPRKGIVFVRAKERWKPLEWRPEYMEILSMSCTGMSNIAIAELKGLTPQHVSNILCTEEAKSLRQLVNQKWLEGLTSSVPNQLTKLQTKAMQVIDEILSSSEVKAKNPISLLRESISILKGVGVMKPDNQTTINTQIQAVAGLPPQLLSNISEALDAGKRVRERYKEIESKDNVASPPKQLVSNVG